MGQRTTGHSCPEGQCTCDNKLWDGDAVVPRVWLLVMAAVMVALGTLLLLCGLGI